MSRRRSGSTILRVLAAAAATAVLLVGVPVALVVAVGNPLPTVVPSWSEFSEAITRGRIDPLTQVKALAVVAWLAWANLASSFVVEAIAAGRGGRAGAVRSLAATQWLAARLVGHLTLVSSIVLNTSASAPAASLPPMPSISASPLADGIGVAGGEPMTVGTSAPPASRAATAVGVDGGRQVGVKRLDTLWSLAEAHLGSGENWRALRDANVGRVMADGTRLEPGFTHLEKGWSLIVPASGPVTAVEIDRGDNLWNLSAEQLGRTDRSTAPAEVLDYLNDVIAHNGDVIEDPDLIFPGEVFAFPDPTIDPGPDLTTGPDLHPGPGSGPDPGLAVGDQESTGDDVVAPSALAGPVVQIVPNDDHDPSSATSDGTDHLSPSEPVARIVDGDDSALVGHDPPAPDPADAEATGPQTAGGASIEGSTEVPVAADDGDDLPMGLIHVGSVTLGAGGALLAAGALSNLRRRRRYRRAHRSPGRLPAPPERALHQIERALNRQGDPETAEWIWAAIGSLAARPIWTGESIAQPLLATFHGDFLEVQFSVPDPMAAPLPWASPDQGHTWQLPRLTQVADLPTVPDHRPAPTVVTVGVDRLVNLEALGVLSVIGRGEAPFDLVRSMVHELATSPAAGLIDIRSTVTLAGTEAYGLVRYEEPRAVQSELLTWLDGVEERLSATETDNAFALRLVADDDPVGPVVLVIAAEDTDLLRPLLDRAATGRHPLAVVVIGAFDGAHTIEVDPQSASLSTDGSDFEPQLLSEETAAALGRLLVDAVESPERPVVAGVELSAPAVPAESLRLPSRPPGPVGGEDRVDVPRPMEALQAQDQATAAAPEPPVLVRVLGEVAVDGIEAELTSQQLSIFAYLACHGPVSRSMLIDALWDGQVISQSRLPNLLTELRARVGRQHLPEAREGRYELAGVTTDLAVLERGVRASHGLEPEAAAAVLRPVLDLIRGVPFTPPSRRFWSWVSDESHLAAHVEAVVADTALRLSALERSLGNIEAAQWACQQGLLASPTDESLVVTLTELYVEVGKPGLARRLVEGWEDRISRLECGDPSDEPRRRLAG